MTASSNRSSMGDEEPQPPRASRQSTNAEEDPQGLFDLHLDEHFGHQRAVYCVAFSPNGQMVLTGGADREAKLWNVQSTTCMHTFYGHEQWVMGVAFANTRMAVATACDDRLVRIWTQKEDATSVAEGWIMTHELGGKHDEMNSHRAGVHSVSFARSR